MGGEGMGSMFSFCSVSVCVVHCCGMDSLPWDLGMLTAIQGSSERFFPGVSSVSAYGALTVTPSLGTLSSALDAVATTSPLAILAMFSAIVGAPRERFANAKTLLAKLSACIPRVPFFPHYSKDIGQWVVPVPFLVDGLIVRRSAQILHKTEQSAPP